MVIGLEVFKEYFEKYSDQYIIIGGTACDILIGEAGFTPRATKDIDIILVVEALNADFVKQFWQFIKDGGYNDQEKSTGERQFYRFINPAKREYPLQLELFARNPDLLDFKEDAYLTPIPVDDDISNLSAILLDDAYYKFVLEHSILETGLHIANTEALIILKAKAFLDLSKRKAKGENIDSRKINKHKTDVFRLAVLLTGDDSFELPESIRYDFLEFSNIISTKLPGKDMFKEMGLGNMLPEDVFEQLLKNFQIPTLSV